MMLNAAETGNTPTMEGLINKDVDINCHNKEDWTTLHIAVNEGHY